MNSSRERPQEQKGMNQDASGKPQVDDSDYYSLLGIPRDATQEQIKKGYKKMALKYHPDHGGDAEIFKKVSHAYSVLSDPEKKEIYDNYGEEGLKEGMVEGSYDSFDPFSVFGSFFNFDPFGDGMDGFPFSRSSRGRRTNRGSSKPEDIVQEVNCTLEEIYTGAKRMVTFRRHAVCKKCNGNGSKGNSSSVCQRCGGRGVQVKTIRRGNFIQQSQTTCSTCHGSGRFISKKDQCMACRGEGIIVETQTCEVSIPRGATDGETIRLSGMGDHFLGRKEGDVVFVIREQPSSSFLRRNENLGITLSISLAEALCGFSRVIEMPDKRKLQIASPAGTVVEPGSLKVVYGEGMPSEHTRKGDLFIQFRVVFPKSLESEEVEKLREALRYEGRRAEENDVVETVPMMDADPSQFVSENKNRRMSEESESRDEEYGDNRDGGFYERRMGREDCSIM